MPMVRLRLAISLDGFVAGPDQSVEHPLGVGGMRLHEWAFRTVAFRRMHALEGGVDDENSRIVAASFENLGAIVMGRNMFGGQPGPWDPARSWNGWWGANPPFHRPVFVLTHHPREPLVLDGENTFTFVTDGITSALDQARRAAGQRDVQVGGGADTARQFLSAGLVDAMVLNVVPLLLGRGERLLDGVEDLHGLTLRSTIPTPEVVHLQFRRS